ncbi:hypothetical protein G6011_11469 [Alternaria panax]|uniref:Uncharacterized protein n=1 Tax=Alternaria panax TaxID=48097 RepID=A0AAD4IDU2_9PLEO|nr:hypothetical protein G6011_11469 [Alternaria panax]
MTANEDMFRVIGRGCCGSIWALEHADWVVKRQHSNVIDRSVQNDQIMHRRVIAADTMHTLLVRIPNSYNISEADDRWWKTRLRCFPTLDACRIYKQERIPAVPQPVREHLIATYCPEPFKTA